MKILTRLLAVLACLILLAVGGSMLLPIQFSTTCTRMINAPQDRVYDHVRQFSNFASWSPWQGLDPAMKVNISSPDGKVGTVYTWSGNEQAGSGTQTITRLEPNRLVAYHVHFTKPFDSEADSRLALDSIPDGTKVSWSFTTEMPRPLNLLGYAMQMEKVIGKDYELGLKKLKEVCER